MKKTSAVVWRDSQGLAETPRDGAVACERGNMCECECERKRLLEMIVYIQ